jgi:hypothetical protein
MLSGTAFLKFSLIKIGRTLYVSSLLCTVCVGSVQWGSHSNSCAVPSLYADIIQYLFLFQVNLCSQCFLLLFCWCFICVLQIEPHILCGCKASCLIAKEHHKLRLFEKRELEECLDLRWRVAVGWIKLHNDKPPSVYSTPSVIIMMRLRKIRWVGLVVLRVKVRNVHTVLVEKPK